MVCTFFGHRECYDLDEDVLERAIEKLILGGVDTFYVGHQGRFDGLVLGCLTRLREVYPHIVCSVVLAYLPMGNGQDAYRGCSVYPEGIEQGPPRFAVARRNNWMIDQADCCLCYINHAWGGAYTFVKQAKKKGLRIRNIGSTEL